jgi:hypothetical protein
MLYVDSTTSDSRTANGTVVKKRQRQGLVSHLCRRHPTAGEAVFTCGLSYSNTIHGVKATLRRCEAKLVAAPRCLPRPPQAPRSKLLDAQRLSDVANEMPTHELLVKDGDHRSRRYVVLLVSHDGGHLEPQTAIDPARYGGAQATGNQHDTCSANFSVINSLGFPVLKPSAVPEIWYVDPTIVTRALPARS